LELCAHHRRIGSQLGPGGDGRRASLSRPRVASAFITSARIALVLLALAATVFVFYLWQTKPEQAGPPLRLSRTDFKSLPGWPQSDVQTALASFARGCAVLAAKPPSTAMGGKGYGGTVADWLPLCAEASGDARAFFESNFTPYQLSGGGKSDGLFTGYYEPQIQGSRVKHGAYQTPVYGLPPDLIRVDLSLFSPRLAGEHVSGRLEGQKLVPYAPRAEIDAHGIANAKILFWCDDPVALFFLQIQGSGRVRFDDGKSERIAYAGENGRPYTAIGRVLITMGALSRQAVSLASIRDWLKKHPGQAQAVMEADQSFIFFEEKPLGDTALGSPGTLGAALTPGASLAIDPRLNILGAPYYVNAAPVRGLLIGQDTGGAIRGAVRGDVFFGFGDAAAAKAGSMKASGTMTVLLPNAVAARLGAQKDFP
jgi:membrane-bound lytic murein transglycosylase A